MASRPTAYENLYATTNIYLILKLNIGLCRLVMVFYVPRSMPDVMIANVTTSSRSVSRQKLGYPFVQGAALGRGRGTRVVPQL